MPWKRKEHNRVLFKNSEYEGSLRKKKVEAPPLPSHHLPGSSGSAGEEQNVFDHLREAALKPFPPEVRYDILNAFDSISKGIQGAGRAVQHTVGSALAFLEPPPKRVKVPSSRAQKR